MANLKKMSVAELKEYLKVHRNDDEAFSQALEELISRNQGAIRYSANLPLSDMERIIREKLQSAS
ncbi:MAG: hypothetical protein H0X31_03415 [Nostocaceae cyanobacterium]|nr:hypothetical protein [Nostocaceae cyanobacterium]